MRRPLVMAVSAGNVAGTDRRIVYAGEPVARLVLTDASWRTAAAVVR